MSAAAENANIFEHTETESTTASTVMGMSFLAGIHMHVYATKSLHCKHFGCGSGLKTTGANSMLQGNCGHKIRRQQQIYLKEYSARVLLLGCNGPAHICICH